MFSDLTYESYHFNILYTYKDVLSENFFLFFTLENHFLYQ